jgi:hypothetical protein
MIHRLLIEIKSAKIGKFTHEEHAALHAIMLPHIAAAKFGTLNTAPFDLIYELALYIAS